MIKKWSNLSLIHKMDINKISRKKLRAIIYTYSKSKSLSSDQKEIVEKIMKEGESNENNN